jgi:hypothetical protein
MKYKEMDKKDAELQEHLEEKVKAVQGNARQGSMGFPFAQEKMPAVVEALKPMSEALSQEMHEAIKMKHELGSQDKTFVKKFAAFN